MERIFNFVEVYGFVVNPLTISQNFISISFFVKDLLQQAFGKEGGSLTSPLRRARVNFVSALSNLNVSDYLSNPQTCQCKESKLSSAMSHWRSTGDREGQTEGIVAIGPKYREPNRLF